MLSTNALKTKGGEPTAHAHSYRILSEEAATCLALCAIADSSAIVCRRNPDWAYRFGMARF